MINKINQRLRGINIEEIYCILFIVIGTLYGIITDINETNNLIAFYSNTILAFITYGISIIKNEIKNLVKDEGK